jgi:transcriptional regulator with XRE-family HTH domain
MISTNAVRPVGELLREWRLRRRLSQLDFACDAEISTRHLSFLETGRSAPSREMVLRLAERLEVPLRERNRMLMAAGFAPVYAERSLEDPALRAARAAVDLVLKGHEPFPAIAIDRHWTLVAANAPVAAFFAGIGPSLRQPPVNVLRASLHPLGLAPQIANLLEWHTHVLSRLRHQVEVTADPVLADLMKELAAYPTTYPPTRGPADPDSAAGPANPESAGDPPDGEGNARRRHRVDDQGDSDAVAGASAPDSNTITDPREYAGVVIPFRIRTPHGVLSFFSTTTIFGTPVDVTLSELAIEAFYPADSFTAEALRRPIP